MNPTVTVDNMNFIQRAFAEGGFVMYVIAVIAILALFVIIERMMKLKNLAVDKKSSLTRSSEWL
ncbi:hypothetical protein [Bdellovibrio bacteriovorus]|uniref:hypothetical protein n=1 Tax=Bdellovibrio bacteriovorus TaxID=959 RepID=UPI0035A5FF47